MVPVSRLYHILEWKGSPIFSIICKQKHHAFIGSKKVCYKVRWEFLDKMQQMLCFFIKEGDSALGISAVVEKKKDCLRRGLAKNERTESSGS